MRTNIMVLIAVAALLLVLAAPAAAQTARTAFVNSDIILRDLPEAKKAQEELERVVKGWQDELQRMSAELQKGLEEYQQKQALYNPE